MSLHRELKLRKWKFSAFYGPNHLKLNPHTKQSDGIAQLTRPLASWFCVQVIQTLHDVPNADFTITNVALETSAPEGQSSKWRLSSAALLLAACRFRYWSMQTFSKVKWLTQLVQVPRCCSWRSGGRNQVCRSSLGCSHRPTECQTQRGTHSGTEQSTEHSRFRGHWQGHLTASRCPLWATARYTHDVKGQPKCFTLPGPSYTQRADSAAQPPRSVWHGSMAMQTRPSPL